MIFKNWSCERIFLVVAMIVGTILIFLTPPMCTPDENCHFLNSYAFSTGQFTPSVKDGKVGKYIRNDIINFEFHLEPTWVNQQCWCRGWL